MTKSKPMMWQRVFVHLMQLPAVLMLPTVGANVTHSTTCHADDFGAGLYLECISNSTTYNPGDWEHVLSNGKTYLKLTDLDALRDAGVMVPEDTTFKGYRFEPELACMVACASELGDSCRAFTYDGISKDRNAPAGRPAFTL
jgi:hypothetical protein